MPSPRPLIRLASATLAATAAVTLTACGTDASTAEAEKTPTASAKASATPKSPAAICAEIVGYWAGQELRGNGGYGDYQSRGLSDSQNNILLDVVAEAKTERKKHGTRAAEQFAEREAKKRCDELYADGGPTPPAGGWPA